MKRPRIDVVRRYSYRRWTWGTQKGPNWLQLRLFSNYYLMLWYA